MAKLPPLSQAVGKFLHANQNSGHQPNPYEMQQAEIRGEESLNYCEFLNLTESEQWGLSVHDHGSPGYGYSVYRIEKNGKLVYHAAQWDSSD
jgi:hypothetical protein